MVRRILYVLLALLVVAIAIGGRFGYRQWHSHQKKVAAQSAAKPKMPVADAAIPVRLSEEARKNLGLISKPLQKTTYWRKIEVPGVITDRPGVSDRGVVAPVTGIVTRIHAYPGDTIQPESPLFSLRPVSESVHTSQLELFKATKEIEIAKQHKQRLEEVAESGALAKSRIIELDNQVQRMGVNVQAYRQDLLARGVPPDGVEAAAKGEFITEITVRAPGEKALETAEIMLTGASGDAPKRFPFSFEMQDLKVELGQQVEAGEVLCYLADHRALFVEGRAFKKDLPHIQQAALNRLPVDVGFEVEDRSNWPPMPKQLAIHHVANVIDRQSRTFAFYLALENQWQIYTQDGQERLLWRFRPGDRTRLSIAIEELQDVYVLPRGAVVLEGPEAYVFRQNGDFFDRRPVHILYEDSASVVLASDGDLRPGFYIAQNAAASLNRVLKAQMASGLPANVHVHADGTVHAAH